MRLLDGIPSDIAMILRQGHLTSTFADISSTLLRLRCSKAYEIHLSVFIEIYLVLTLKLRFQIQKVFL
jgi:hypothetical protein